MGIECWPGIGTGDSQKANRAVWRCGKKMSLIEFTKTSRNVLKRGSEHEGHDTFNTLRFHRRAPQYWPSSVNVPVFSMRYSLTLFHTQILWYHQMVILPTKSYRYSNQSYQLQGFRTISIIDQHSLWKHMMLDNVSNWSKYWKETYQDPCLSR